MSTNFMQIRRPEPTKLPELDMSKEAVAARRALAIPVVQAYLNLQHPDQVPPQPPGELDLDEQSIQTLHEVIQSMDREILDRIRTAVEDQEVHR